MDKVLSLPGSCSEKVTDGLVNRLIAVTHTLKTVTCHSGRYRGVVFEVKVYMYLGRRPESDAAEISKTTPHEHCGLARSTPLQRGTPHTFALTSLSTPWHSSHAAFHDHSGLPAGTSPPIAPPRRALCWPRPHGRRRVTMHIHRHR